MKRITEAQIVLETHLKELGLKNIEVEHRFARSLCREWRSDYFIPAFSQEKICVKIPVLVEIEGGAWSAGRHTRGKGYSDDCLKYSTASAMGFKVFRFTTQQVLSGDSKAFLKKWL